MCIHDTKLPCKIENLSVLVQERVCNVSRVSIIVPNGMQKMGKIINNIYFIYSTICSLRDRLYSPVEELKECY